LVTSGATKALYLAGFGPTGAGDLHLTTAAGVDHQLATGVRAGQYQFSPDGRWVMMVGANASDGQSFALRMYDTKATAPTVVVVIPKGLPQVPVRGQGFFSASGHYWIQGVLADGISRSADLHAIDLRSGKDVFQLGDGAFDYPEVVLKSDVMVYQNTIGGKVLGIPPVQGLFMVSLPQAASGATPAIPTPPTLPTLIDTQVGPFVISPDESEMAYVKTDGTLFRYDLAAKTGHKVADEVISVAFGPKGTHLLAYLSQDTSLHAVMPSGTRDLPAGSADPFSPLVFSPDASHLYFYQSVEAQEGRGTLLGVSLVAPPLAPASRAQQIATGASLRDVSFAVDRLVLLDHIDGIGLMADVGSVSLDGTGMTAIGTGAVTGDLRTQQRTGGVVSDLVIMNLVASHSDAANAPVDGSRPLVGALGLGSSTQLSETHIDAAVHTGMFELGSLGHVAVFASGAKWDAVARNYVGTLKILEVGSDEAARDAQILVSELGPVDNHALFVNAPTATPPGVYVVKF
jgi:hypothetical protein